MAITPEQMTLYILVAAVFAIIYSLRVLVMLERTIAKMDMNIEKLTKKILQEEYKIEAAERQILKKTRKKKK